jgi:16S rRNA processing protein RimM
VPRPEWVQVGRVARAHGLRGEVRVAVESDNPERFVPGSRLFGRPGGPQASWPEGRIELVIDSVRGQGGDPIVAFAGVSDRDHAEALKGVVLEIPIAELPEPGEGEYYSFDVEGLEVRTPSGRRVGVVAALLEAPANDILVVATDPQPTGEAGGEVLLPFVEAAVPEVDVAGGFIVVAESFLRPVADA